MVLNTQWWIPFKEARVLQIRIGRTSLHTYSSCTYTWLGCHVNQYLHKSLLHICKSQIGIKIFHILYIRYKAKDTWFDIKYLLSNRFFSERKKRYSFTNLYKSVLVPHVIVKSFYIEIQVIGRVSIVHLPLIEKLSL